MVGIPPTVLPLPLGREGTETSPAPWRLFWYVWEEPEETLKSVLGGGEVEPPALSH